MKTPIRILGIAGSLRRASYNRAALRDRLIQSIALAANCVTILGLLLVIFQLRENRTLMRAQVRHELASAIVDLLNSSANNSQLASVMRRAGLGEQLTADEQFPFRLRSNALLCYWEGGNRDVLSCIH